MIMIMMVMMMLMFITDDNYDNYDNYDNDDGDSRTNCRTFRDMGALRHVLLPLFVCFNCIIWLIVASGIIKMRRLLQA